MPDPTKPERSPSRPDPHKPPEPLRPDPTREPTPPPEEKPEPTIEPPPEAGKPGLWSADGSDEPDEGRHQPR